MNGLVLSAPSSGAGKTALTLGLLRALRNRGVAVRSAKSGPDYIDPAFHAAASGQPCVTLDPWCASADQLRARVFSPPPPFQGEGQNLLLVEGAMGLFDGALDPHTPLGHGSTADTAAALKLPVILVIDAAKTAQTSAAIAHGLKTFRPDTTIAGVILNRIGSAKHERMLRGAVETVLPVLGAIPRDAALAMPDRHLGLVQAQEMADLEVFIANAAALIEAHCDLNAITALASAPGKPTAPLRRIPPIGQRISVARDTAFSFAYPHMLSDWRAQGAELTFFSPLADEGPHANGDAIYLPGGYPELHAATLANAGNFRQSMLEAATRNTLIYGECGGYMTLGAGMIDADGTRHAMLGLLDLETSFAARKLHLGYRTLTPVDDIGWAAAFKGHEFHYTTTLTERGTPLFRMSDSLSTDLGTTGLRRGRIMGSFAHVVEVG